MKTLYISMPIRQKFPKTIAYEQGGIIILILYSKIAVKHINELDKTTKLRIKSAIEKIPFGDIKKLKGFQNDYRLRVGNLRVLFSWENDKITIKDVLPRGQAYKNL